MGQGFQFTLHLQACAEAQLRDGQVAVDQRQLIAQRAVALSVLAQRGAAQFRKSSTVRSAATGSSGISAALVFMLSNRKCGRMRVCNASTCAAATARRRRSSAQDHRAEQCGDQHVVAHECYQAPHQPHAQGMVQPMCHPTRDAHKGHDEQPRGEVGQVARQPLQRRAQQTAPPRWPAPANSRTGCPRCSQNDPDDRPQPATPRRRRAQRPPAR